MTNYYSVEISTKEILKANIGKNIDVGEASHISIRVDKCKGGDVLYIILTQKQNSIRIMVEIEMCELENYLVKKYTDNEIYVLGVDTGRLLCETKFYIWCNKDLNFKEEAT